MPTWTPEQLNEWKQRRLEARGNAFRPVPKPPFCAPPFRTAEGEAKDSARIAVRIISYRRRLLDPDNFCPKYFIDGLRYSGLIPDDRPQDITLEVRQEKVGKGQERTEIEIVKL